MPRACVHVVEGVGSKITRFEQYMGTYQGVQDNIKVLQEAEQRLAGILGNETAGVIQTNIANGVRRRASHRFRHWGNSGHVTGTRGSQRTIEAVGEELSGVRSRLIEAKKRLHALREQHPAFELDRRKQAALFRPASQPTAVQDLVVTSVNGYRQKLRALYRSKNAAEPGTAEWRRIQNEIDTVSTLLEAAKKLKK